MKAIIDEYIEQLAAARVNIFFARSNIKALINRLSTHPKETPTEVIISFLSEAIEYLDREKNIGGLDNVKVNKEEKQA